MRNSEKMKTDTSDCYGFMRLTHTLAVLWGLPITRRRTNDIDKHGSRDTSVVQGHRYTFDWRVVPVWLAYAALDAFIMYYNYLEASGYVGSSFKTCFEESYCVAVIELANRNLGPFSVLACVILYGRRHKVAALAGTERTLAFLRHTDRDDRCAANGPCRATGPCPAVGPCPAAVRLSPVAKYYSAVVMAAYWANIWLYTAAVPAVVIAPYCVNALTQTAVHNLALFQYYVLERGYARVNRLLEAVDVRRGGGGGGRAGGDPQPRATAARSLARLADAYDDLGRLVDHLNRAYALSLMIKWPYTIIRLIMVVFRIIELVAAVRAGNSFARVAAVLMVEHIIEILMFLFTLSLFCAIGNRLAEQAGRTSAILQKLKLIHAGFHLDLEVKKTLNIFWVRVNARKVNATIGGYIIINMDLMKAICGVIATYFLVLIQFEHQKGNSKPLHQIWN